MLEPWNMVDVVKQFSSIYFVKVANVILKALYVKATCIVLSVVYDRMHISKKLISSFTRFKLIIFLFIHAGGLIITISLHWLFRSSPAFTFSCWLYRQWEMISLQSNMHRQAHCQRPISWGSIQCCCKYTRSRPLCCSYSIDEFVNENVLHVDGILY